MHNVAFTFYVLHVCNKRRQIDEHKKMVRMSLLSEKQKEKLAKVETKKTKV